MTGGGEDLLEHWAAMVGACRRLLGSLEDAEDCASAALLGVVQRGGVGDVDNPRAWLVAVAKRRAADVLRARARDDRRAQRLAAHHDMVEADVAEAVAERAEARWLARTAEAAVPAPTRDVVRALAAGMTVTEAADELGMTKRAAESHLHRARTTWRAVRAGALGVAVWAAAGLRKTLPAAPQAALAAAAVVTAIAVAPPPAAPTPGAPPVAQVAVDTAPAAKLQTRNSDGPPAVQRTARRATIVAPPGAPAPAAPAARPARRVGTAAIGVDITEEHRDGPADPVGIVLDCLAHAQVGTTHVGC